MDDSKDEEIAPQMAKVTEHEGSGRKDITREDQLEVIVDDNEGKETILEPQLLLLSFVSTNYG